MMNARSRPLLLLLLASLALAAVAYAAPAERKTLVLRGRVADAGGWPLAGARVSALGTSRAAATTDESGRYILAVALPGVAEFTRSPFVLRVRAALRGWRVTVGEGAAELALEVSVGADSAGAAQLRVRSSDADLAAEVARALAPGGANDALAQVEFVGAKASGPPPAAPVLASEVVVPLPGVTAPRQGRPPAVSTTGTPAASRDTAAGRKSATTRAAGPGRAGTPKLPPVAASTAPQRTPAATTASPAVTPAPQRTPAATAVSPPVAPAPQTAHAADADSCACGIHGTVEVQWERPLEEELKVVVGIAGNAAVRDTVTLFMGSPREFELRRAPCGLLTLEVQPLSRRHYRLALPGRTARVECAKGTLPQARLVLVP